MNRSHTTSTLCLAALTLCLACSEDETNPTPQPQAGEYIVLAWNDLGMHCINAGYDSLVLLPPYNTVWAQVIHRGNPPRVVTSGITVEYRLVDNTTSYVKRTYGQFWDNSQALFGVTLQHDHGLNLTDPSVSNGLSGSMLRKTGHFQADGIPAVPVNDAGAWSPYQVVEVTVRDSASGGTIAQTRATVPVSDEINCTKCHGPATFKDILRKHDSMHGTQLQTHMPVLCASCHPDPALGTHPSGHAYLSEVIHGAHASRDAACYDCHPGQQTSCNRSVAHTAADGHCTTCHGDMARVASTINSGARTPWAGEPACADAGCHSGVEGVSTGTALYRQSTGHGGVYCVGCHGSPHTMYPSKQATDNYQPLQYQNKALTLGDCRVCHGGSHGGGSDFGEEHGGANATKSACAVCHTQVSGNTGAFPHAFSWKNR